MSKEPNNRRKKILFTAIITIAAVLLLLFVFSEAVLPAVSEKVSQQTVQDAETRIFADGEDITPDMLSGYDSCIKDIYYKKNGTELLITDGKYYEFGGYAAVMFAKYIDAVKNGDSKAYAECFSPKYDSENGIDRFASGEYDFPPQRLYDIHIECLDEHYDEASGKTLGIFCVTYRIYLNTGDFRNDITDDTAPLIFVTEQVGDTVLITDISYRY